MHKIRLVALTMAALALTVPAMSAARAATATPKPTASFAFKHDRVKANTKLVLTYRTAHLPAGAKDYLQRQFGSAHVWKNVMLLKAASGTATAPGVQIGKYAYRMHVTKSGKVLVNSRTRSLYSYGTVALSTLCADEYVECSTNTVQIGDHVFSYVLTGANAYPDYSTVLKLTSTSCNSMDLQFGTDDTTSGAEAYIEVIQTSSDPEYGSTPISTIGTFTGGLDGGPFYLEVSETNEYLTYVNGTANCYTLSGLP
jgi:hypothetical protein